MQENNTRWAVGGIIVVIAIVGFYMLAGSTSPSGETTPTSTDTSSKPTSNTPVGTNTTTDKSGESIVSSEVFTLNNNIQYMLESFSVKDKSGTVVQTDQRLMSVVSGKRVTVISSIKQQ